MILFIFYRLLSLAVWSECNRLSVGIKDVKVSTYTRYEMGGTVGAIDL